MHILKKAQDVLFNPEQFIARERKERHRWKEILIYLLVFAVIGSLFLTKKRLGQLENILAEAGLPVAFPELNLWWLILFGVLNIGLLFALTSLKYYLAHYFITKYNPKAAWKNTYAELTYGGTPGWLAIPFFLLGTGLVAAAVAQGGIWQWIGGVSSLLAWLGLEGYSIYLRVYALAEVQRITRKQALLSVYVWGLLAYLLVMVVLEFILIFMLILLLLATGAMSMDALSGLLI